MQRTGCGHGEREHLVVEAGLQYHGTPPIPAIVAVLLFRLITYGLIIPPAVLGLPGRPPASRTGTGPNLGHSSNVRRAHRLTIVSVGGLCRSATPNPSAGDFTVEFGEELDWMGVLG